MATHIDVHGDVAISAPAIEPVQKSFIAPATEPATSPATQPSAGLAAQSVDAGACDQSVASSAEDGASEVKIRWRDIGFFRM